MNMLRVTKFTLHIVCAVHWGMSWVQWEISWVQWEISWVHWGMFSTLRSIMSISQDTMINVGKVIDKTIEFVWKYTVHWASAGILMIFPECTHRIPLVCWTRPPPQNVPNDIPRCTTQTLYRVKVGETHAGISATCWNIRDVTPWPETNSPHSLLIKTVTYVKWRVASR